jgi:hypothetical protein
VACTLDATTKSSPRHSAAEGKKSSSPRTKDHEALAGGEAKASSSPRSAGNKLSGSGSGQEKRAKAQPSSSKKEQDASTKKASPRADGGSADNNNPNNIDGVCRSSPRKDHDRLIGPHSIACVTAIGESPETKQLHQSS